MFKALKKRALSFKYAFEGIWLLLKSETHFQIDAVLAICAVLTGFYLEINATEWLFVISAITVVLVTEALNSAVEKTCDAITLEKHPKIKMAKDIAAGAALLASTFALVVGFIVFWPKI